MAEFSGSEVSDVPHDGDDTKIASPKKDAPPKNWRPSALTIATISGTPPPPDTFTTLEHAQQPTPQEYLSPEGKKAMSNPPPSPETPPTTPPTTEKK